MSIKQRIDELDDRVFGELDEMLKACAGWQDALEDRNNDDRKFASGMSLLLIVIIICYIALSV